MTAHSKSTRLLFSVAALVASFAVRLPDVSYPVIEYRVPAELGQVRITTGLVHDPATQGRMLGKLATFDQRGLILVAGDSGRQIVRRETIGPHTIETLIHVYPATGRGFGGGLATADIVISVDGTKRVDCPYIDGPVRLDDIAILPADGMITIAGSYNDQRFSGLVFMTGTQLVDMAWIQRKAK